MTKTITLTYGRWRWANEDMIIATSCPMDDPEFIKYGDASIEVEIPSKKVQDSIAINNLREEITKTRAESQRKVELLEERVQQLMALE